MSTKDRVNVFLRHRFHVLRKLDLLTSQEISRVFGMGANATPINQALLKLFNAGFVTRLMRKPSNTYEWRTSTITVAPTDAELQCLPPELLVQLEREEAALKKAPAAQQIPIPEAADLHRAGLPTVVVPAPSFGPPTEPIVDLNNQARAYLEGLGPDAADLSAPPVVIDADLARETRAAEYRADVTAAALEELRAVDLEQLRRQEPESSPESPTDPLLSLGKEPPADPEPITTLSDVLERYRARQESAILESAMNSALSQLAQPERIQLSVPDQVLWALAKLGPALPPPIGALLAEAHAILSKPLLTAA